VEIKDYITAAYDYTYWANRRYMAVAEALTAAQLHQPHGQSWGDVHSLLVHMMSSETVWLKRWRGESPEAPLNPAAYPTLAKLKSAWAEVEAQMMAFMESQTEESLQAVISYNNFKGEAFRVPLWQLLMHVANHDTHHRGELAAMFALMNVPHPEEEVIQYFLDLSGQKKF
jgi:uncharacterized damage-inducible protein DinB